ncbi:MAG TPA: hypothetical protein VF219_03820 [Vicinamibacterales bacterium]
MQSATQPQFAIDEVRRRFPSLEDAGPFVFLNNAAGAQIIRFRDALIAVIDGNR